MSRHPDPVGAYRQAVAENDDLFEGSAERWVERYPDELERPPDEREVALIGADALERLP